MGTRTVYIWWLAALASYPRTCSFGLRDLPSPDHSTMISLQWQECFQRLSYLGVRATTDHTPIESSSMIHGFHGDLDPKIKVRLKISLFQWVQMLKGLASWRGLGQPPSPWNSKWTVSPWQIWEPKDHFDICIDRLPSVPGTPWAGQRDENISKHIQMLKNFVNSISQHFHLLCICCWKSNNSFGEPTQERKQLFSRHHAGILLWVTTLHAGMEWKGAAAPGRAGIAYMSPQKVLGWNRMKERKV